MARDIPSDFSAFAPNLVGTGRAIDIVQERHIMNGNPHYLYAYARPMQICTTFRSDTGNGAGDGLEGRAPTSPRVSALWCIEPPGAPFTEWSIYALVKNTDPANDATLRFDLASDPHPGTSTDITVAAGAVQWTQVTGSLTIDNTQTTETIRMWAISGAAGTRYLSVQSVMVIPQAVSTIPAGVNTQSGYPFVPTDSSETTVDRPLSVRLRRRAHANLMHIYRTRPGMCLAYSDSTNVPVSGNEGLSNDSTEYVNVARVPIFVPQGTTALRWSVVSRRRGSSGNVRLRTASMDNKGDAAQVVSVPSGWSSPYDANLVTYADAGQDVLNVYPSQVNAVSQDELIIDIQGDGARATVHSVCVWFERVDA